MKLNKITIKNFLSYGNDVTEFTFENGMYLITGDNGFGKSVILEAIVFGLYGDSIRDVKLEDLINWDNGRGLFVSVHFESNGKEYCIERGMKPNLFKIIEDGITLDNLSSKVLTQSYLDNNILGMDKDQFISSCMLTTHSEIVPLMNKLTKRKFFESMFNVSVIDVMKTRFKNELSNLNKLLHKSISENEKNKGLYEGILITINEIDTLKNNMIEENTNIINSNNKDIEELELKLVELKNTYNENSELYNSRCEKFSKKEIYFNNILYDIEKKKKENKFLTNFDVCDHCNQAIDSELKETTINNNKKYINEKTEEYNSYNLEDKRSKLNKLNSKVSKINNNIQSYLNKIESYKKENISLNRDIDNADKKFNKKTYDNKKKELELEIEKNSNIIKNVSNNINELNFIVNNIFSDDGIRKYVLDQYIDYINDNIRDILNVLEIDFSVYITSDMDIIVDKLGKEINYNGVSSGQQRMINFALMLTIIKIRKIANPNTFNILFLDEFIDIALSETSVSKMASMLSSLKDKLFVNDIIYVISHRLDNYTELFNKRFSVNFVDNFSEIVEVI